jgi:hypothetical protein
MVLQLRIASPCEEKWESMQGDARVRNCARCALNVFNIKEMTEPEVRALFLKTEGRVCGRIFQRKDGTVLMRDCPTGLAKLRRKALAGLTLALSLVVAVINFRLGAGPSCPTGSNDDVPPSWFSRVVEPRMIDARETLRETRTFGPVINELFPEAMPPMAGLMMMTPPPIAPAPPVAP